MAKAKTTLPPCLKASKATHAVSIPAELMTPDSYVIEVQGDCMVPICNEGDYLVCSPSAELKNGDLAAMYFAGHPIGYVKRLVMTQPADLIASYRAGKCVGIVPTFICEQVNPRKQLSASLDKLAAVHAVLHVVRRAMAPRRQIRRRA